MSIPVATLILACVDTVFNVVIAYFIFRIARHYLGPVKRD